jgi:hypothetical protein
MIHHRDAESAEVDEDGKSSDPACAFSAGFCVPCVFAVRISSAD